MVATLLQAAEIAAEEGTSAEVIDLRSLSPIDYGPILESVQKTGRLIVAQEAPGFVSRRLRDRRDRHRAGVLLARSARAPGVGLRHPVSSGQAGDDLPPGCGPRARGGRPIDVLLRRTTWRTRNSHSPTSARVSPRPRSCRGRSRPATRSSSTRCIVEIETAKSLVELPSPFAGVVTALLVEEGQTVEVGTPIISVDDSSGGDAAAPPMEDVAADAVAENAARVAAEGPGAGAAGPYGGGESSGSVLVGYGTKGHGGSRRRRAPTEPPPTAAPSQAPRPSSVPAASASSIIAKPPIRKLAKDLNVDLGDGERDRARRRDHAGRRHPASPRRPACSGNIQTPEWGTDARSASR